MLASPRFVPLAAELLARGGPRVALHLRGHATAGGTLHAMAEPLRAAAAAHGAWFFVNDRVDIALALGADGVQLGRRSVPLPVVRGLMRDAWLGYSAHAAEEAARAASHGTDFVVMGTIYRTPSHAGSPPAGPASIARAAAAAGTPILAIGGVTPDRILELARAGAHGAAVLGGVWHAGDPVAALDTFMVALAAAYGTVE